MKTKHTALAALFGVAIAIGASGAFAAPHFTYVMTDPCAKVMNSPVRSITFDATPPSERGLQCPIQDDFTSPWND